MTVDIQSFKSKFKKGTVVNFLRILNLSVKMILYIIVVVLVRRK